MDLSHPGVYWQSDNFILGSKLEHQVYWTGDCCTPSLDVNVRDILGGQTKCSGGEPGKQEITGLIIAIGVTSGLWSYLQL